MDYQQKAAALNALDDLHILFRSPRDRIGIAEPWYIAQNVSVYGGSVMIGAYGNGATPEAAIEDHWNQLTRDLKPGQYLVARRGTDRRAVTWNGFMWEDYPEPRKIEAA